jgi:hypothetical protein
MLLLLLLLLIVLLHRLEEVEDAPSSCLPTRPLGPDLPEPCHPDPHQAQLDAWRECVEDL